MTDTIEKKVLLAHIHEPGYDTLEGYERFGGYKSLAKALREMDPEQVLEQLQASGLRGRGGAGFAMGKKASFIPRGAMDKYLCCNADESEPGAFKDRLLMQKAPHQLVEGCIIGSIAAGATKAFIFIRGEYSLQADILDRAVGEAYAAGYLGERILDTDFSLDLVVHRGAGAYICGEESALLDALEGKRGNPRLKPPFPANQGLYQGPTLINNVETLSNVPLIIERGGDWFASLGTEKSPGTKIVSVSGNVQRPGNYEIELGIPARELVHGLAGGPPEGRRIKCWFPGGSSSPVLLEEHLDLPYDFETMAQAGSMLGSKHSVELVVHRGAGAYICGEESALLDALEGKRGNPRLKPPFPANQGLYQGPTLINNVETLSCAPLIIERGADWFRSYGTDQSAGTKVVSVSGNVQRPGNYEVELGITGRELVYGLAGGPPEGHAVKCWFPGGSSAPVLLDEHLDLPYTFEDMDAAGSMLGSGAIIVVDDSVPIVHVALRLAEFYRHESCGKCVPCREGTQWTVKMLERVDSGAATPMDLEIMAQVQENIIGHCLCVLGDSMAMPIGSMIKHFRDEFEQHIQDARAQGERELLVETAS